MENKKKGNRFKILERDNFTCQYCGRKAPEVILEVDHITPTSKGGEDIATNMITACRDCNRGKKVMSINIPRPKHIELSKTEPFVAYRPFCIRMDDRTWGLLKRDRFESGLSWNMYIRKKLEELEYEQKNKKI
jgi:hypothetical protein